MAGWLEKPRSLLFHPKNIIKHAEVSGEKNVLILNRGFNTYHITITNLKKILKKNFKTFFKNSQIFKLIVKRTSF